MQTLIDFVKSKSIADTSMAMAYKMLTENLDQQEHCLLLLFQSMYEANSMLAAEVLKLRQAPKPLIR